MTIRAIKAGIMAGLLACPGCRSTQAAVDPVVQVGTSAFWGDLEPGPFAVGFRSEYRYDASRPEWPEQRPDGSAEARQIARRLQLSMWYPAARATSPRMRLQDYVNLRSFDADLHRDRRAEGVLTPEDEAELVHLYATYGIMQGASDSGWRLLLHAPFVARRGAPPVTTRFPLVVLAVGGVGSAGEFAITAEYLASHGYVVVGVPSRGRDLVGTRQFDWALAESQAQDLEYAIAYAAVFPFVDVRNLAVVAFSAGARAAALLQLRNSSVDAVVALDGTGFRSAAEGERLRSSAFFEPARTTAAVLDIYAAPPMARDGYPSLIRHADTYSLSVQGIHHVDFTFLSMIHTALGARNRYITSAPGHIRMSYAWINRYVRTFLDAYVKRDAAALVFLQEEPQTVGAPTSFSALKRTRGRPVPPAAAHLLELLVRTGGVEAAMQLFRDGRERDPEWVPFPDEQVLNILGPRLASLGRFDNAVGVLQLNAELHSSSPSVHSALGDVHQRAGNRDAAIRSYRRVLELSPRDSIALETLRKLEGAGRDQR